jgi:hypothetical protein
MTIPIPALDDRTFTDLVTEARARIPVHTPEWTNLNASDPGITIVDLFAFLTENLLYRSNRIPEAVRLKFLTMLGISLQPPTPGTGLVVISNDKGPIQPITVLAGSQMRAQQVPFQTGNALSVLPVSSAAYYKQPQALDAAAQSRYQLIYQTFLGADTDQLTFYQPVALDPPATGKPDPVVDLGDPVNGTIDRSLWLALLAPKNTDPDDVCAAIGGQTLSIGVYPAAQVAGQVLPPDQAGSATTDPGLIVEIAAPEPDLTGMAGPRHGIGPANYVPLPISYADPVLRAPGLIQVTLPDYRKLLLWAFNPEEEGTGDYPPRVDDADVSARLITWIRLRYQPLPGEAADATQAGGAGPAGTGDNSPGDGCGCGCGCGGTAQPTTSALAQDAASDQPNGRITWAGVNATTVVQSVAVPNEILGTGTGTPFQTLTVANHPVIAGSLTVEVSTPDGWQSFAPIDDIYAAAPDQLAYLLDPASGAITFGSGLAGSRVPLGATVRASYRYGGGLAGQVAIGGISKSTVLPGGCSVSNPVATWGAADGESTADGEAAITRWLRHRDRLVTADDFHDLTWRTPAVDLGRVEVLPMFNPDAPGTQTGWPGMVTILVIPRSDPVHPLAPLPDRTFLNAVCAWLAPRRLITTELHVRGPLYQPVWVSVGIEALPGQVPSIVEQAVTAAVRTFLSPLTGGLDGAGWPLGVNVRSQDVEAVATRVPGVRYVNSVLMAGTGPGGAVISPLDPVPVTGLRLPSATVFARSGDAADPATLIGGSQPALLTQVPVPVVPPTC